MTNADFVLIIPELAASLFLIALLVLDIFRPNSASAKAPWMLGAAGAAGLLILTLVRASKTGTAFGGMLTIDPLAVFFKIFFSATVFVLFFMSREFFLKKPARTGGFLLVVWISLIGLFFLVSSSDLLLMFVALEIFTLSLYILAAYLRRELVSIEAGLKYFILGSLASAFLIYGIALLYVAAGATSLVVIRQAFASAPQNHLFLLGILFVISGLGFKIASVPFQLWVPDVYEGAPTPVAAYLSVASKSAGFALLLRLLFTAFPSFEAHRILLFSVLAAMTLLYGNLGALMQTNIKRLFGYSSIGHAGYLLIGLAIGKEAGVTGLLYYLIAFGFSNLTVFLVLTIAGRELESDRIDAYRGLAKRSPFLAGTLFLALLSLAGIPPLAGFFGKFLVLLAAVQNGLSWLALLGLLGVAISLYYYLSVVRTLYFEEPREETPIAVSCSAKIILILLITGILLAGLWQAPFFAFSASAAHSLF